MYICILNVPYYPLSVCLCVCVCVCSTTQEGCKDGDCSQGSPGVPGTAGAKGEKGDQGKPGVTPLDSCDQVRLGSPRSCVSLCKLSVWSWCSDECYMPLSQQRVSSSVWRGCRRSRPHSQRSVDSRLTLSGHTRLMYMSKHGLMDVFVSQYDRSGMPGAPGTPGSPGVRGEPVSRSYVTWREDVCMWRWVHRVSFLYHRVSREKEEKLEHQETWSDSATRRSRVEPLTFNL